MATYAPFVGVWTVALALCSHAADLSVEVSGAVDAKGLVSVSLYDSKDTFLRKAAQNQRVPASAGKAIARFLNLKPGTYAVSTYHDLNGNGKLDVNFMGYPTEPWGFSNNPQVAGRPDFSDAKLDVGSADVKIEISLR